MEMNKSMKSKSVKYKKSTLVKLPLRATKSVGVDNNIPEVVITPSSRGNSLVEPAASEDHVRMNHLSVPTDDWTGEEHRKQSIMSLFSFMTKNKERPSIATWHR